MSWRVAKSLETLRMQLNNAFPKRSKVSDGSIGDLNHSARSSDHNPLPNGVVCARDFTHDPVTGIDCNWLAAQLVKNKDSRIKYIIWNKKICSSLTAAWTWRPYNGVNAHRHHLHLSVKGDAQKYDDAKLWALDFPNDDDADDVARVEVETTPENVGAVIDAQIKQPSPVAVQQVLDSEQVNPLNDQQQQVENPQAEQPAIIQQVAAEPVTVKAVATSIWSKVIAGFAAVTGLGINAGTIIESKLSELSMNHIIYAGLGIGLIVLGIFYYKKRQEAADLKTHLLIQSASAQNQNTIHLTK